MDARRIDATWIHRFVELHGEGSIGADVWPVARWNSSRRAREIRPAMVVKLVVWLATATPASLVTPLIAIAICVLEGSGACGIIVVRV